ncbi:MAG TPA: VCBS repeat-containing protein [Vicinamibacterales bacterium]
MLNIAIASTMTRARRIVMVAATTSVLAAGPHVARAETIVVGIGSSGSPQVKTYDSATDSLLSDFLAYDPGFTGGVRVAVGDVNGDGVPDIVTGPGPGGAPLVKVFNGATGTLIRSFFAFTPSFTGGVFVAAGDVNGDGAADIIVGADAGGGPNVKVFDGATGATLQSFFAYDAGFTGGVRVAAGDVNGDGVPDIVTGAGPGGAPHVKVFNGTTGALLQSFLAFSPSFTGGVFVAAGDTNNDDKADIVVGADAGGGPQISVFDAATNSLLLSFFAFAPNFAGGVRVAAADMNGDGVADIIAGAGPGGGPAVSVFDGHSGTLMTSFFSEAPTFTGGTYVAGAPENLLVLLNLIDAVRGTFDQSLNLLGNALQNLNEGKVSGGCNMLGAFVNLVQAQSGKSLTVQQANQFMASATSLRSSLGCR